VIPKATIVRLRRMFFMAGTEIGRFAARTDRAKTGGPSIQPGSYAHIYSDIYRTLDRCLQATLIL